jgi:hypothetical protein
LRRSVASQEEEEIMISFVSSMLQTKDSRTTIKVMDKLNKKYNNIHVCHTDV